VLVITVPSRALDANCYIVAPAPNSSAIIIDPGLGTVEAVAEVVAHHGLRVRAVIASHGHLDHIHDAPQMCAKFGAPLWIHQADRHLLTDPWAGVDGDLRRMLEPAFAGKSWLEPDRVQEITDGVTSAGALIGVELDLVFRPAPGHTGGSMLIDVAGSPGQHSALLTNPDDDLSSFVQCSRTVFTGDVLFAGSIGRTDFPVSSAAAMEQTLAMIRADLPPDSAILAGHGPATILERELATNPWLAQHN